MNSGKIASGLFYLICAGILYNFGVIDLTIQNLVYRSYPEGKMVSAVATTTWLLFSFIILIIAGLLEFRDLNNNSGVE